jgi:Protein of unknown function VcgC/VcgE (DUF2780)
MQRRSLITSWLALVAVLAAGQPSTSRAAVDPYDMAAKALGMTKDQMQGGLGSVLTLAQEKLQKGDFDKVAAAIPGASGYVDQAKKLGAVNGPLKNLAGLNGALGKLGIKPDTASKFLSELPGLVSKVGGEDVGKLLGGVLK